MGLASRHTKDTLAKFLFLVLPTMLVCYFILWNAAQFYAVIMENQYIMHTVFVELGILAAVLLYSFRLRFGSTFLLLILVFYLIYFAIDRITLGKIDVFFVSIQFTLFALLFSFGWLLGWGFSRKRYFPILAAALFFVISLVLIAKQSDITVQSLLQAFVPLVLYTAYIIYAVQVIYNNKDLSQRYWWFLTRRLGLFILLSSLVLAAVVWVMEDEIKQKVAEYGAGGKAGQSSMLQKNKDGSSSLKDHTQLSGGQGRDKQLLFVAHIKNYFSDNEEEPNPLYLTAFYYSKFDTESQTFERDAAIPRSDLFLPNPATIPLYFTKTDSTVLKDALTEQNKKVVEIEVYKTKLSATEFVAPSTSFFIQPIAIDKSNKNEYTSAYRAKSYVSELNSAYFVYNTPDNPQLQAFQDARFQILRQANDYSAVPLDVMHYYTKIPVEGKFARIAELAREVTKGKVTAIDKMIAIRDYFLSKDENGKPLFKYSDNPGIPDIPSASKLDYFLFENRKGYCAYYAGATLFMLRSLGVPSRITVGFLTMDRSGNNNKGWYWYYADQAHAWVQVYFPGYGWLDFDTTVGNDDARESPQPDGTPPTQPGNAVLALNGVITQIDTLKKSVHLKAKKMIFKDKEYQQATAGDFELDLSIASIQKDSSTVALNTIKINDSATAISFAEAFKNITADTNSNGDQLAARFPKPAPIDELHIKSKIPEQVAKQAEQAKTGRHWRTGTILLIILSGIILLGILFVLLPLWYRIYLQLRKRWSKTLPEQAYWDYTFTQFYLHQYGLHKGSRSALQFAEAVDQKYALQYAAFIQVYLKLKYGHQPISAEEQTFVTQYRHHFLMALNRQIPRKQRNLKFLNPLRTISFWRYGGSEQ
ncbi:hypothetical protein DBR32_14575 [Taibaiella sp. KBW10]|uniref:transglutaminase domain-containing protein n=1 Tax=Taibaiella sp. KBW10 TaxID=2153357 RepID=UPI000F59F2A6|nr:transglutaminase domain-containing protein [Taibaiella sp. KBW10]RQO29806.1 hypothetical protein DBR32_14575 [Taibaiella sp. KBW10]